MSLEIDPSLLSSIYHRFTSYTNSFFLLRVPLMINGQTSAIGCSEGMLTLNSRYPSLGITFDSLFEDVNAVAKKYGISQVTKYWIEDVPLFKLEYSSADGIKKFIHSAEMVQSEIATKISARIAVASGFTSSHQFDRLPVMAHTEVFLISPELAGKDADLKLVTLENLSACLAKQMESEVFNFGDVFRRYRIKGYLTSHQLLEELNEIVEWYHLGIRLGITEADLNGIKLENDDVKGCRSKMLSTWLEESPQPAWATIINALTSIGRRSLAYKMAWKYGIPVASLTETKQVSMPVPTPEKMSDSNQQKLKSEVQELQSSIESKDMELLVSKQTATEAQNARYIARGRLEKVGEQAVETQTKVTQLLKKSSDAWDQLELKQRTLKAFQKLPESEKAELQVVIDHTNQEIQKLQEELETIQAELESEKKKACSLPDQLSQANKELAEKSARVQELEWVRQKLDTLLELERKRVDQLLMQVAAASNLQQYNMEMKHQLVTVKKELEAKIAEVANLKQTLAYQDAEVKRLSAKLRSKEALLHVQILLMQLSQATKPDHTQELKLMGELQRLTEKVSELRVKLLYAEDAKQEAQRQMEAAELKSRLLQEIVREYRQNPPPVPPRQLQRLAPELQESRNPPPPVPPKQLQRQAPQLQESEQTPPPVPPRRLQQLAPELQESRKTPPPVPPKRLQNPEPELQESRQTSLSVTPTQSRKPATKMQQSPLPDPRKDSWEYRIFTQNSAEIVDKLAHMMVAAKIASKLNAAGIIGDSITEHVYNYGPWITERFRLQHIIAALKDKIHLDARKYYYFRDVILSLGADADTALPFLPEKDPKIYKSATRKARSRFEDQGHVAGQKQVPYRMKWLQASDTPEKMCRGATVSHGKMAYFNSESSTSVYCYCNNTQQQLWSQLPHCHSMDSALVMVEGILTTVGGRDQHRQPTASLTSLTDVGKERKWVELFPQMPTARYLLTAVCTERNVIAAGGYGGDGILTTVEILDTKLQQWFSAISLPYPMYSASITVCEDSLYLLGGYDLDGRTRSVLTCSIPDLLHEQQVSAYRPAVWHRASDTPYYGSTAVNVGDQLLAIGGCKDIFNEYTSAIVAYDTTFDFWKGMARMTTPRSCPLVALLPNKELIVAGGFEGAKTVEIGKIY